MNYSSIYLHNFCKSANIGKDYNKYIFYDIISNLDTHEMKKEYIYILNIIKNESIKKSHIIDLINKLHAWQVFSLFKIYLYDNISDKLIECFLHSNNIHIYKIIIFILIKNKISHKLIKMFYKYYGVNGINHSKEELLLYLCKNKPEIIIDYYKEYDYDKIDNDLFQYFIYNLTTNKLNPQDPQNFYVRSILKNALLSDSQFDALLELNDVTIDCIICINASFPKEKLHILLNNDRHTSSRLSLDRNLSYNTSLSVDDIQKLIRRYKHNIRDYVLYALSENTSLSKEQFRIIINETDISLQDLCCNKALPSEFAKILIDRNDYNLHRSLASNTALSQEHLQILLDKNDPELNVILSKNTSLSKSQIDAMFNRYMSHSLAENPLLSTDQIDVMLSARDDEIDCALCQNPSLSEGQFDVLFNKNQFYKQILASNPSLPEKYAIQLIEYKPVSLLRTLNKKG